jgi:hypothetical protein
MKGKSREEKSKARQHRHFIQPRDNPSWCISLQQLWSVLALIFRHIRTTRTRMNIHAWIPRLNGTIYFLILNNTPSPRMPALE